MLNAYIELTLAPLQDAAVMARCLEGLQLEVMVKEGAHWAQQAAKLEQRVAEEERALAQARVEWEAKLRALDAQVAAAHARVAQ